MHKDFQTVSHWAFKETRRVYRVFLSGIIAHVRYADPVRVLLQQRQPRKERPRRSGQRRTLIIRGPKNGDASR